MSSSKEEGKRVEMEEVSDPTDSKKCQENCNDQKLCTEFRNIMEGVANYTNVSELKLRKKEFETWMNSNDISLTRRFCADSVSSQSVLKTALGTSEGCKLIEDQLNTLNEYTIDKQNKCSPYVKIKIGSGKLFDKNKCGDQSRILKELLSVTNRSAPGKSKDALTALIKHPVMVIFLCEKWEKIKLSFFIHLRYWLLFLLAYSLLLRVDINKQLLRKDFEFKVNSQNITICKESRLGEACYEPFNLTCNNTQQLNATNFVELKKSIVICHPERFERDTSRITLLCLGISFTLFFLVKLFWVLKHYFTSRRWEPSKNLTVVTSFAAICLVLIAFIADTRNTSVRASTPLFEWDDGLLLLQWVVVLLATYLLITLMLKMLCHHIYRERVIIATFLDPEVMLQWITLISSFVAVWGKNSLQGDSYGSDYIAGITSVSLATATGVIVIIIGHSGMTTFGNFATMFHNILKKIPSYFLAILYLIHGFSFGFWILENKLSADDNQRNFDNYWRSAMTVFSMAFGLAEFQFDGPFKYEDAHNYTTKGATSSSNHNVSVAFAYILLCLMVFLVSVGLLNLLLTTIITDHKTAKSEVTLNNLIFKAQYAILVDYTNARFRKYCCWPPFTKIADFIQRRVDIEDDAEVMYCARYYCPYVFKEQHELPKRDPEESKHIEPHFEWVLEELTAIDENEELRKWKKNNKDIEGYKETVEQLELLMKKEEKSNLRRAMAWNMAIQS